MPELDDSGVVCDFLKQGGTLQALMHMNPHDLDLMYSYACQLFDAGDYVAAKRCYFLLARLSHWQYEYWLSLGLCCQRLMEHEQAVVYFGRAGLLKLDNPQPAYLAGCSCIELKQNAIAAKAFKAALKWCANKEQYKSLKVEIKNQLLAINAPDGSAKSSAQS